MTDDREKIRAHAQAMADAGRPASEIEAFVKEAMSALQSAVASLPPITPGHSKFTPDELVDRAEQSRFTAMNEKMDDITKAIPRGLIAGSGVAALPAAGRTVINTVKGAVPALKGVGSGLSLLKDVAMASKGNPVAALRAWGRLEEMIAKGKHGSPAVAEAAAPASREEAKRSLEQLLQNNVDEGMAAKQAADEAIPASNPDLMRRIEESLLRAKAERAVPKRNLPSPRGARPRKSVAEARRQRSLEDALLEGRSP